MIVIAALLAMPSIVASLLVRRRRGDDSLAPMLALTGFLPSLALLVAVFKEGPMADYAVALSEGSWVLLFVSVPLLLLFFPERRFRGRDRWLAWAIAIDALLFVSCVYLILWALRTTSPEKAAKLSRVVNVVFLFALTSLLLAAAYIIYVIL